MRPRQKFGLANKIQKIIVLIRNAPTGAFLMNVDICSKLKLNMLMAKSASGRFRRSVPWARSHKFYSLLLLTILLVAGIFVYERVALELNKRAFSQARATIDTIYADIVAQVDQPDNSKHSDTCSIYTEVYSTGPTYCNIVTTLIYGVKDESEANNVFKKIQLVIESHNDLIDSIKPLSSKISAMTVANAPYYASSDRYKSSGLNCVANYIYDTPQQISLTVEDNKMKPLEITLGCNGKARADFYSLVD